MVHINEPEDWDHPGGDGGGGSQDAEPEGDGDDLEDDVPDALDDDDDDDDEDDDIDVDVERSALDDIEDEFADFIDEEMGYADVDWDTLPQKQVDEHDRIRRLASAELADLDLRRANDLNLWAAARAHLDHGHDEAFEEIANRLLTSKKKSKALDYIDIALALMGRRAKRRDFEAAFSTLDKLGSVTEGADALVARFRGILTIQKGDRDGGLEQLAQLAETRPDDAEFLLSLGEDLCGIGMWEPALEYLEVAEELARASGDNDLLSSIENAAQFAQRHIAYDDVDDA